MFSFWVAENYLIMFIYYGFSIYLPIDSYLNWLCDIDIVKSVTINMAIHSYLVDDWHQWMHILEWFIW